MENLSCYVMNESPEIEDYDDKEEYYDGYWQCVLDYPLIMLPKNKIIFWGFEVSLLKNEYDLLKTIITLNSTSSCEQGFSEEQIIENIEYKRRHFKLNKIQAANRFIITSKSRIKKQITKAVVDACINRIEVNQYNPFIDKKEIYKRNFYDISTLRNDKNLHKEICTTNINLIKIFTHMSNFTSMNDKYYSSFILQNAFSSLISSTKGQKQKSLHRFYKTDYVFSSKKFQRNTLPAPRIRCKDERFTYAKVTPTKHNLYNFINS